MALEDKLRAIAATMRLVGVTRPTVHLTCSAGAELLAELGALPGAERRTSVGRLLGAVKVVESAICTIDGVEFRAQRSRPATASEEEHLEQQGHTTSLERYASLGRAG